MKPNLSTKFKEGGSPMTIAKRICGVVLLMSFLALAGCPDMVQQGGGSSSQSGERERGGGGGD
jgi:hypothetical protein